jgi:glycosyltransferase involved in cell wall biosynthesis
MRSASQRAGRNISRPLVVHHFGPDPAHVGGIGSVIRVLSDHLVGSDEAVVHPTWRPNDKFGTIFLFLVSVLGILRMPKSDVVHVHLAFKGSFIRKGALMLLGRLRRITTVATIHGSTFLPFANRHPRLVSRVLRHALIVTCLDQEVLEFVSRVAPHVQVELVPNPVSMDSDSPGADNTQEIVVFAGEIGLRKGADVLCQAWRRIIEARPEARCMMVGPIKDFVVPDIERLEVLPPIDAASVRKLLRSARVIVLPSRAEGMPMILTEAMSSGRPFVSTPVGGIPELAEKGGVLVPVGDDAGLAKWLIAFLADPQLARKIGEQGRQFCLVTRSVEAVDKRFRELYQAAQQRG